MGARSLRWTALSEEFVKRGHEVYVIAGYAPGELDVEDRNGVHVHRVRNGWLDQIRLMFKGWYFSSHTAGENTETTRYTRGMRYRVATLLNTIKKWLTQNFQSAWRVIYWPDGSCLWVWPAVRCARQLMKRNNFDVLISVSHPFSGHVAGLMVHRRAPAMRWLADNGDPFYFQEATPANNFRLWHKVNYWAESQVIKATDAFSVTTYETAEIYQNLFNNDPSKFLVIPPLLNNDFRKPTNTLKSLFPSEAIILLYIGGFYGTMRNPVHLLDLFEKLLNQPRISCIPLQLHFIGAEVGFIERELQKRPSLTNHVFYQARMSHRRAIQAMFEADILINMGNPTSYQLPSKVVEYMATGKPILNITTTTRDTSARKFQRYPLHFNWFVNGQNNIGSLCSFIERSIGTAIPLEDAFDYVRENTLKSVVDQYLSAILKER